jgi:hypothetical protein
MDSVHLVSFASNYFSEQQKAMELSAKKYGILDVISYTEKDLIDSDFYNENIEVFKQSRGFGHWLWKPYFILKAIESIADNDILCYVDAGSMFVNSPATLISFAKNNESGIVAFDCWPLTNHQWTKRDTFVNLNCDIPDFWYAKHVIATVILFRKTPVVILFLKEWLTACLEKTSLIEGITNGNRNIEGFVQHREDQAIFSVLIKKYNIETYRNPSKWGNFLKLPKYRKRNEFVSYPYLVENSINQYSDKPYVNSPYYTIFEFNSKNQDHADKKKLELFENILKKISSLRKIFR